MNDIKKLLASQSRWQRDRKSLSWPEKIHWAERMRAWAAHWRSTAGKSARSADKSKDAGP